MPEFPSRSSSSNRLPLVLDTDIGTDIDDVYALILAAVSPEFDLCAVTVVNSDVNLRARLARHILDLLDRSDVPVSMGASLSLTPGERRGWMGHEGLGISLPATLDAREASVDAAQRIAQCAAESQSAGVLLTVCTIGAMTNLALALRCYPETKAQIGQVVAMASDYGGFGPENARWEHNVACDPVAVEIVLRSGLPITLVGLNVTSQTAMTQEDVKAIEAIGGPLSEALVGMHRVWLTALRSDRSPMHDGLALSYLLDSTLLPMVPVSPTVQTHGGQSGVVQYDPPQSDAPACQIATSVDVPRFTEMFQGRIRQAVRNSYRP